MMKRLSGCLLLLALLILALALNPMAGSAENANILGKPFPDFTVTDTQGNTFSLSGALKDHEAVLLNIFTSWCGPCEYEFPFLNELYPEYQDRVAFIALSAEPEDTTEIIEEYRQSHGIDFPMGLDEGAKLLEAVHGEGFPTTAIIDRFGNLAFCHSGAFSGTPDIRRLLDAFVGDGYTETTALTAIPRDVSTQVYPVSAARNIIVENEGARQAVIRGEYEGEPETHPVWVIPGDTACLRLEISPSDIPGDLIFYDEITGRIILLPDLLDPERNAFTIECQIPTGDDVAIHYLLDSLVSYEDVSDPDAVQIMVFPGEEYLEEYVSSWGYAGYENVTWAYEEAPAADAAQKAYILHVVDQDGNPVPDVYVSFCTDQACVPCEGDETGTVTYTGKPAVYHIQIVDVPEGYSYDETTELYTAAEYGEMALRLRRD